MSKSAQKNRTAASSRSKSSHAFDYIRIQIKSDMAIIGEAFGLSPEKKEQSSPRAAKKAAK